MSPKVFGNSSFNKFISSENPMGLSCMSCENVLICKLDKSLSFGIEDFSEILANLSLPFILRALLAAALSARVLSNGSP